MFTPATSLQPRIAVVVPIFRHSVLLVEAIESVLAQTAQFAIRTILVNDGCPHAETDQVCRDYATAYPDRITYLRKPNGGLSDARNYGIRHALNHFPSVEAVYMLDADNRLRADALGNAMAELDAHPEAGWIYPNIDMFGLSFAGDYGGDYSVLIHTVMNVSEAGSLIRRSVFEADVFFDTDFKSGFEDWDFFLTAAEAGFRGRNAENFGFLYRKRPESMLADSTRDEAGIRTAMQMKHKALLQTKSLLSLEHGETPRYGIVLSDRAEVILATDPSAENAKRIGIAEFEENFWRAQLAPSRYFTPPIVVVTTSVVFGQLHKAGMLHSTLWSMECRLRDMAFVAAELTPTGEQRIGMMEADRKARRTLRPALFMARQDILSQIARDSSLEWVSGLTAEPCIRDTITLTLKLPEDVVLEHGAVEQRAAYEFIALANRLQSSPWRKSATQKWDWREPDIPWRKRTHEIPRKVLQGGVAYPRVPDSRRHMGFLMPLVEFGGVEKVALHVARAMKQRGWVPHLFVLDAADAALTPQWREVFESVTFLGDSTFRAWGHAHAKYFGTDVPDWSISGNHNTALGMMTWLDAAINFHGGAISGVMGKLKRFGVKTGLSLHLSDQSPVDRPAGNTYLGLAFEHAYDMVLPCSMQLGDWCHAMGVPEQKIVPIVNAPGFDIPARELETLRRRRRERWREGGPLRVLYLGRVDRQKGLNRLTGAIQGSIALDLPVEFRVIGKTVLADNSSTIAPELAARLEKPLSSPKELADAYAWADVVILLSSYEGLPLTVLEAMRQGAVPLATDVGAVAEVVRHGENGMIVPLDDAISGAVRALDLLSHDREMLVRLSEKAMADMDGHDWTTATDALAERLDRKDTR